MLTDLRIRDFAIIDDLGLEFGPGTGLDYFTWALGRLFAGARDLATGKQVDRTPHTPIDYVTDIRAGPPF